MVAFNEHFQRARGDIFSYCKMLRFTPTAQQEELFKIVQQESMLPPAQRKKRIAVKSGQGPGKTAAACVVASWRCFRAFDGLTVITAPTQRQVRDVFMAELSRIFSRAVPEIQGLVEIDSFKMKIAGRKDWGIKAVTSNKPENVQGYHQTNLTFVLDEASGVPRPIWDTIKGTLSNHDALLVAIGNPNEIDTAFYDCFYLNSDMWHTFTWNAEKAPHVDKMNLRRIEKEFGRESDVYRVRVLGEFPRRDPTSIISAEDLYACAGQRSDLLARQKMPNSEVQKAIGIDLARYGADESVIVARRGLSVVKFETFVKTEPSDVVRRAFIIQKDFGWPDDQTMYVFDAGGIGQGVAHMFYENFKQVMEFHSQGKPFEPNFKDRISEGWFNLRELVHEHAMWLPSDRRLIHQLSTRRYNIKNGKIEIESKDDYKKRIGTDEATSPDRADAMVLAFYPHTMAATQVATTKFDDYRVLGQDIAKRITKK